MSIVQEKKIIGWGRGPVQVWGPKIRTGIPDYMQVLNCDCKMLQ